MAKNLLQQRIRTVNWLGASTVILLMSATAALGVLPMWKGGNNYIHQAQDLRGKQAELETLRATLRNVDDKFHDTQQRLASREDQLPSWEKEPNFYGNELTKIRKADGIQLTGTDLSKDLKNWNGNRVGSIEVRGSGDWSACAKFLADIREMKGLTRLDSLVLDASHDSAASGADQTRCDFRLSFSIFFKGE